MPEKQSKQKSKAYSLEQIENLFAEAKKQPELADRYVDLARKIAMKVNIRIPRELKRKYCKHCNSYFQKGNYRVRTRNGYLVYTCFKCKKYTKYKI